MSPELIGIISVGVALLTIQVAIAGLGWASIRDQNRRVDDQRMEVIAQIVASEQRLTHRIDRLEDRMVRVEDREETTAR